MLTPETATLQHTHHLSASLLAVSHTVDTSICIGRRVIILTLSTVDGAAYSWCNSVVGIVKCLCATTIV